MEIIDLGDKKLTYSLKRSKRKTLGIAITANAQVIISAPEFIPLNKIEEVLQRRKDWIVQKLKEKELNFQLQPKRRFISGESIYLFGKQYYLNIVQSDNLEVKRDKHHISFFMPNTEDAEDIVSDFLEKEFNSFVFHKSSECLEIFLDLYPIKIQPQFRVRKMSKRWGSCTKDGVINLNSLLVAAAPECIEYVIFHELTHLVYSNHDTDFYRALKKLCPNYKVLKNKLDSETVLFEE